MNKLFLVLALALASCSKSDNSAGTAVPPVDQNDKSDVSCDNTGVDGSTYLNGIVSGQKLGLNNPISNRIVIVYNQTSATKAEICTGSLLPGNVILTAGHCVVTAPPNMLIIFNNNMYCVNSKNTKDFSRRVTETRINPGYDGTTKSSSEDLAMIHFSGSLYPGFTTFDFPTANFKVLNTDNVIMAGYGRTGFTNEKSGGVLRITKLPAEKLKYNGLGDGNILIDQQTTGICLGDSGSGLLVYRNSRLEIIGVASTVSPMLDKDESTACSGLSSFVDLSRHQNWLQKTYDELRDR